MQIKLWNDLKEKEICTDAYTKSFANKNASNKFFFSSLYLQCEYHIYERFNLLSLKEKFHEILIFFGWMQKWLMMFAPNSYSVTFSSNIDGIKIFFLQCLFNVPSLKYTYISVKDKEDKENRWVCNFNIFFFSTLFRTVCFLLLTKAELVNVTV